MSADAPFAKPDPRVERGFYRLQKPGLLAVGMPHWFPLLILIAFATMPWVRYVGWRFSLRTLLIATTIIAVVLGLIVWAAR